MRHGLVLPAKAQMFVSDKIQPGGGVNQEIQVSALLYSQTPASTLN
jgi:hypothetical protein